ARLAAAQGHGAVAARHQLVVVGIAAVGVVHQLALEEHAPELVGVEPAPAAGADRTVEGDQASAGLDRAMQRGDVGVAEQRLGGGADRVIVEQRQQDRKSTRLNSSHVKISYAVFCLKKKKGN